MSFLDIHSPTVLITDATPTDRGDYLQQLKARANAAGVPLEMYVKAKISEMKYQDLLHDRHKFLTETYEKYAEFEEYSFEDYLSLIHI